MEWCSRDERMLRSLDTMDTVLWSSYKKKSFFGRAKKVFSCHSRTPETDFWLIISSHLRQRIFRVLNRKRNMLIVSLKYGNCAVQFWTLNFLMVHLSPFIYYYYYVLRFDRGVNTLMDVKIIINKVAYSERIISAKVFRLLLHQWERFHFHLINVDEIFVYNYYIHSKWRVKQKF